MQELQPGDGCLVGLDGEESAAHLPPPPFFGSADSKGVMGRFFVSVDSNRLEELKSFLFDTDS